MRLCLLTLTHYAVFARHYGQNKMHYGLRRHFCWPQTAASAMATVRTCGSFPRNLVKLRKDLNLLKLFRSLRPLQVAAVNILRPFPQTNTGKRFI